MKFRTALGLIVLLTAISSGPQQAQAALRACNQANFKFNVAIGYVDREKGWVGKGWWVLERGQCKDLIAAPLDNRYYYFHAWGRGPDRALVKYDGETSFCIQPKKFMLYQAQYGKDTQEECSKAGLQSEMFHKIDVNGGPDYTIDLRGPDNPAGGSAGPAPRPGQRPAVEAGGAQPPRNRPSPAPSAAPSGRGGTACERYPNLC